MGSSQLLALLGGRYRVVDFVGVVTSGVNWSRQRCCEGGRLPSGRQGDGDWQFTHEGL
jgi:hypothetical protein